MDLQLWTRTPQLQNNFTSALSELGEIPESLWLLLAKLVGATAGSAISIVYVLPKGRRDALVRFFVGLGIGVVFGSATGIAISDYLGIADRLSAVEISLSGSAAASLCSWWGLGVLSRFANHHHSKSA